MQGPLSTDAVTSTAFTDESFGGPLVSACRCTCRRRKFATLRGDIKNSLEMRPAIYFIRMLRNSTAAPANPS